MFQSARVKCLVSALVLSSFGVASAELSELSPDRIWCTADCFGYLLIYEGNSKPETLTSTNATQVINANRIAVLPRRFIKPFRVDSNHAPKIDATSDTAEIRLIDATGDKTNMVFEISITRHTNGTFSASAKSPARIEGKNGDHKGTEP